MNPRLIIQTVCYLKPTQVVFQILNRIHTPGFKIINAPLKLNFKHLTEPIPKPDSFVNNKFRFLNIESEFTGWMDSSKGALWQYNLNYFDFLNQNGISKEDCIQWMECFNKAIAGNHTGLDPYPTALRCINWIKFMVCNPECISQDITDSLYSQLIYLSRRIESHLLGNHILEDAFALTVGASFFNDTKLAGKAQRLIKKELDRQILPDGAHFEQSPMYHAIMLDRLLDCINYLNPELFDPGFGPYLRNKAALMLGHLKVIAWNGSEIPLLNDSALGIAPTPDQLSDYASRLGIRPCPTELGECGYRKLHNQHMTAIVDIGNITATYQPGHTHADTFNYELRIDGKPFICDTGISTYQKDGQRQYERSTAAHNTVTMNGMDSSSVWGGFRVASRARVFDIKEQENQVCGSHNGYGNSHIHTRKFCMTGNGFIIRDCISGPQTVSNIHFAPDVKILSCSNDRIVTDMAVIEFRNATGINISKDRTSREYNSFCYGMKAQITFSGELTQTITLL